MQREIELTILMPCLNEARTIGKCIDNAVAFLTRSGILGEVLIADNGSTDGSQEIVRRSGALIIDVPTRGYGAALLAGIAAARGKYIIMGDADDSYDFLNLDEFVSMLRDGYDVVMGNRFKGGIAPGAMPLLHRYLGNPILSMLGRVFFKISVGDFHCGLRGFNSASIRRLNLVTSGMEFASEMVVRAAHERYRIADVPTVLRPDGRDRPPHLRTWRDGWRHLKFLLMYSPRWLFVIPGAALFSFGIGLATILSFGPFEIGRGFELDINAFIAACFMVIAGVQLISLGVLARYYASITGMMPGGLRANWIQKSVTTDSMVCFAAILLFVGLIIFGTALYQWAQVGFGRLTNPYVQRAVVASLSLVVISIQLGFQGFMIGILQIPLARAIRRTPLEAQSVGERTERTSNLPSTQERPAN